MLHTVYVPAADDPRVADIASGSGIVGELQEDGGLLLDFEGNVVGSRSLERYANRVLKAAARRAERYPTRARVIVPPETVTAIGEYDRREHVVRLTGAESERLLADWLGTATVDPQQLIARRE